MAYKVIKKGLKRTALSAALGMCFASSVVLAQAPVGSINGSAKSGATVQIENTQTGQNREITADSSGNFSFSQLAPGTYKVTSDGVSRTVEVRIGTGTRVDLAATGGAADIGTVQVVGTGAVNPIDVSSVESTSIFTDEQLQKIPVGRDSTSVALLAPGTTRGSGANFNGLASFGGSSVAENGYYVNGFDVTNIYKFLSFADLPYEAIAEQQIKTGGYGAEFGRSLGGVINIVTKRGTNEWNWGASVYWNPSGLREHSRDVVSRLQTADDNGDGIDNGPGDAEVDFYVYQSQNTANSVIYNLYGSGPIIKDRLFFFGLIEGRDSESDTYGYDSSTHNENGQPRGMLKLDWNITDNHLLELTAISDRTKTQTDFYFNDAVGYGGEPHYDVQKYTGRHGDLSSSFSTLAGGETYILKYTGYLTDNFTLSILGGHLKSLQGKQDPAVLPGFDCPAAIDARNPGNIGTYIGCWDPNQFTLRNDAAGPDTDKRTAWRVDAEWHLGDHLLRFGIDREEFTSIHGGSIYSGGIYYRYRIVGANGAINLQPGFTPGQEYVRVRTFVSGTGAFKVENDAMYLEDSWQITDNLLLYLGLRSESFSNYNTEGESFVDSGNLIAPRLGFSWDVNGDSTLKVFGNAGRYYIPVATNTNIRAAAPEGLTEQYYLFNGIDPVTGAPLALTSAQIGPTRFNGITEIADPRRVASSTLSPMYQDEYILGFQKDMGNGWTIGTRAIYRDVGNGFDDFCAAYPMIDWAADNGYDNFDPYGDPFRPSCILINPGEDNTIALNLEGDGELTDVTIPASYWKLPKYKRNYKAIEFFWERQSERWSMQGSYTWAKSYGNVEGYIDSSSLQQTDAGLTQNFDHEIFMRGSEGFLQNDRRHSIKMFGTFNITDEWRVGANLLVQSGSPISCRSFVDLSDPDLNQEDIDNLLAFYAGSAFTCRSPDEVNVPSQRGKLGRTPWTYNVDASLAYQPQWLEGLTVQMDVFNVFNSQQVVSREERSAIGSAATNGYNPDFQNITGYQAPRQFRFSVRYDWK